MGTVRSEDRRRGRTGAGKTSAWDLAQCVERGYCVATVFYRGGSLPIE